MTYQTPRFQQPNSKAFVGKLVFAIQKSFPLGVELFLSKIPFVGVAFSRLRDGMVSHRLQAVYFPIPKSACTLFATFIALNSDQAVDFNVLKHNIHGYRQKNGRLNLDDMTVLTDSNFYRFTVIRDPYARLVSGYVDKLVKPIKDRLSWATYERCGQFSFEHVVEAVCRLDDAELDKHFRPQISFFRNVPMDHIGLFEHLDHTFGVLKERFGVDIESEVATNVRAPKRTSYQRNGPTDYIGNLTAAELAERESIPPVKAFYNERLRQKVAQRFKEDFDLHDRARRPLGI